MYGDIGLEQFVDQAVSLEHPFVLVFGVHRDDQRVFVNDVAPAGAARNIKEMKAARLAPRTLDIKPSCFTSM